MLPFYGHHASPAATYAETAAVMDENRDPVVSRRLDELLRQARFMIEPVTEAQPRLHGLFIEILGEAVAIAPVLILVNCFAYALAKAADEPLLFKGKDFGCTDIKSALP